MLKFIRNGLIITLLPLGLYEGWRLWEEGLPILFDKLPSAADDIGGYDMVRDPAHPIKPPIEGLTNLHNEVCYNTEGRYPRGTDLEKQELKCYEPGFTAGGGEVFFAYATPYSEFDPFEF